MALLSDKFKLKAATVPGPTGPAGADGKSAYQIAVDNGFVGTEAEWLTSLQGADGLPGIDGTGMAWRGPWDNATNYAQYDGIEYNGSTYIANAASLNKIPGTDPEWDLMVAKGPAGADGAGIVGNILTLPHAATPSDPGAGNTAIYAKSDGNVYKFPTGGIEEAIGAGASAYSDLTDVDTTGLNVGQTMVWDGTFWVPGSASGGREVLTANRTYYVRTDGNDSNDGLSNVGGSTGEGAFLTIQKAIDTAVSLDLSIYNVTINIQSGTWTTPLVLKTIIGSGTITIRGVNNDQSTIISTTSNNAISGTWQGVYNIQYLKLQTTTLGSCISASGELNFGNIDFGACAQSHVALQNSKAIITVTDNYIISGSANGHIFSLRSGYLFCTGKTITITGTPNFADTYLWAAYSATILYYSNTFSGSATGKRYNVTLNGVIYTAAATLPGSIAGTVATGGQYA